MQPAVPEVHSTGRPSGIALGAQARGRVLRYSGRARCQTTHSSSPQPSQLPSREVSTTPLPLLSGQSTSLAMILVTPAPSPAICAVARPRLATAMLPSAATVVREGKPVPLGLVRNRPSSTIVRVSILETVPCCELAIQIKDESTVDSPLAWAFGLSTSPEAVVPTPVVLPKSPPPVVVGPALPNSSTLLPSPLLPRPLPSSWSAKQPGVASAAQTTSATIIWGIRRITCLQAPAAHQPAHIILQTGYCTPTSQCHRGH